MTDPNSVENLLPILFASTNQGKFKETEAFFHTHRVPVRFVFPEDLPDVEENGKTFLENALIKARAAQTLPALTRDRFVLAEDSGFEIPELAGTYGLDPFPGIQSHRWMTPEIRRELLGIDASFDAIPLEYLQINAGILKLMRSLRKSQRRARYVCAVVLLSPSGEILFEGMGDMALHVMGDDDHPRGEYGFGYDPIVFPAEGTYVETGKTLAELPPSVKNTLSHRGQVLKQLAVYLAGQINLLKSRSY